MTGPLTRRTVLKGFGLVLLPTARPRWRTQTIQAGYSGGYRCGYATRTVRVR